MFSTGERGISGFEADSPDSSGLAPRYHSPNESTIPHLAARLGVENPIVLSITSTPIDVQSVTDAVRDVRAGAVVLFLGTVREFTGELRTSSLDYEAFEEMALASLRQITDEAVERWSLVKSAVVHRTGSLELGDIAVAVAVSSAHRGPAFEAGQWIMDTIKKQTPIWKKEIYADGRTEWIHPEGGETHSSSSATNVITASTEGSE